MISNDRIGQGPQVAPMTDFDLLNHKAPFRMFWAHLAQGVDDALHGGSLDLSGSFRYLWRGIFKLRAYP